jgi:FMN reductase
MTPASPDAPLFILGIGGSTRPASTTERAVGLALAAAAQRGAETKLIEGPALTRLPIYAPDAARTAEELQFISDIRRCDGLIIGSPGYHGSISGLMKNALDLIEETAKDSRPYLADRAVGCIVIAQGWQASGTTLVAMRSIVHALRGWPTPLSVALNSATPLFNESGACLDERARAQVDLLAEQVMDFAAMLRRHKNSGRAYAEDV